MTIRLEQPIAGARPDGVPPGMWGFRFEETSPACALDEAPPVTCLAYHAHRWRHNVKCTCANMFLGNGRPKSQLG